MGCRLGTLTQMILEAVVTCGESDGCISRYSVVIRQCMAEQLWSGV